MSSEEIHSQFVDEIIGRTLQALSENEAFDDETLARLKKLAGLPDLVNYEKIVEVLSGGKGE